MSSKMLYLVFTVLITFEGIRGNVDSGSPIPIKHVREVLPTSLLFLLKKRPTSGLGYRKTTPELASPIPLSPLAPVKPISPLPPSIPAIPNAPVTPSIPYSPEAADVSKYGVPPRSFSPTVPQKKPQVTQNSSPGQPPYDNSSNGNRKIINIVHVRPGNQPVPIPRRPSQSTLPENSIDTKNISTTTNSYEFNPKESPFEPVNNIEASPIPVKPKNTEVGASQATNVDSEPKNNKDESKNSFQFNPRDYPFEPVYNIEASPIPVKPKNTEIVPSQPTNVDSETKENQDLIGYKNSLQFNPKDSPFEPVKNIEASPIPVKPKNSEVGASQATNADSKTKDNKDESNNSLQFNPKDYPFHPVTNIEASPIPVKPKHTEIVPSQSTNVDSETKENQDIDGPKNSLQFNPNDSPFEPVDNIEASPVPVKSTNTEVVPSQATNVDSALPIAETTKEGPDSINSASNIEAEPSEEKPLVPDYTNTPDISSADHNNEDKPSNSEEPQNPLKDLVLNGNPSSNNADKEESEKAEKNENEANTQNGNSSSENGEREREESQNGEDNLNKETTKSESTNDESPTDITHSASTDDESRNESLPEESDQLTASESGATASEVTNSQSADSQSENSSATSSNIGSSNEVTSEETNSSENTQNKSSKK